MPYQIAWDDPADIRITYTGKTSDKEVLEVVKRQQGDWRFDDLKRVLHDLTGITGCERSPGTLEEIGVMRIGASTFHPELKIAIVSDRAEVIDMLKAFKDMKLDVYPTQIFSTCEAASAWLNERDKTAWH